MRTNAGFAPALQQSCANQLMVQARDCHKLMTNPRSKSDELSETTKTWLKELAIEEMLGLRKIIDAKPMIKGVLCKDDSIDLYNTVMETHFTQNSITRQHYGFRGRPDLLSEQCAMKIVTSWDASTFPFFRDEVSKQVKKGGYDWQCRVYMMLFDINTAVVSYCLVDTPRESPKGEVLLHKWDDRSLHTFEGIVDARKRVSLSETIERDLSMEQQMRERYEVANRYYQQYLAELYYK